MQKWFLYANITLAFVSFESLYDSGSWRKVVLSCWYTRDQIQSGIRALLQCLSYMGFGSIWAFSRGTAAALTKLISLR